MKKDGKHKTETLKRVLVYIRKYRALLAVSLALAFLTVAASLWLPKLVGSAIDCIIGAGQVGSETAFMLANAALAEEIVLVDLPGTYSLNGFSLEEKITEAHAALMAGMEQVHEAQNAAREVGERRA